MAVSTLCATSCSTVYHERIVEYHMINIDEKGQYTPAPPDRPFNQHGGTDIAKSYEVFLDNLFLEINKERDSEDQATAPKRILIYVHGGLTLHHNSIKQVVQLHDDIVEDGFYPIFINWRSFFFTTYGEHLGRIRQGQRTRWALLTAPLYLVTDLVSAVIRGPRALALQGAHVLNTFRERTVKFPQRTLRTVQGTIKILQHPVQTLIKHPVQTLIRNPIHSLVRQPISDPILEEKHPYLHQVESETSPRRTKLRNLVWYWVTIPAKVVLHPFISEIGRPSWEMMRRRNSVMFRKPKEFEQKDTTSEDDRTTVPHLGTGALAEFLQRLDQEMQGERDTGGMSDKPKYSVTLMGYSMGAIVVNQILGDFPHIQFDHVVFLAAAVSTREVLDRTIPYLREHPTTQFYNLSLDPDNDNSETSLIGVEPSGSLLTWVDNYYTTPLTQLDRTFGRWENVRSVLHVFPPKILKQQMHFKIFGFDSVNSPQEHGEFGNYPFWRPNFWWKGKWKYNDYSYTPSNK